MPGKTPTSPFAPAFTSAIRRGTPCWTAVHNIASRTGKSPTVIFNSLCKSGHCFKQKVNGQWVYWPCNTPAKPTAKNMKFCQTNMWQWFVEWMLASGCCTPEQIHNHCGSQAQFMSWCKKFWNHQFTPGKTSGKSAPKSSRKPAPRGRKTTPATFPFPGVKSRPGSPRRYRKVA